MVLGTVGIEGEMLAMRPYLNGGEALSGRSKTECSHFQYAVSLPQTYWNNILTLARSYRKIWPDMLRNGGSMYPDGRRPEGLHWPPISRHEGHIFRYDRDRVRIFSLY